MPHHILLLKMVVAAQLQPIGIIMKNIEVVLPNLPFFSIQAINLDVKM